MIDELEKIQSSLYTYSSWATEKPFVKALKSYDKEIKAVDKKHIK